MTYLATIAAIGCSAWETLQVLDRQSRKDTGKVIRFGYDVYRLLSSPKAIACYRMAWQAIVAALRFCGFCWNTAVKFRHWCDELVEQCLTDEPIALPTGEELIAIAGELAGAAAAITTEEVENAAIAASELAIGLAKRLWKRAAAHPAVQQFKSYLMRTLWQFAREARFSYCWYRDRFFDKPSIAS